jgi:serine/threonine protein kinase
VTANGEVKLSDFGSALVGGDSPLDLSKQGRDVFNSIATATRTESWFPAEGGSPPAEDEEDAEERMLQLRVKKQLQRKQRQDFVGTPPFMAPDIFRGSVPSEATDIWAFGCTLIELLTGKYPWQELVDQNLPKELIMYKIGSSITPPALPRGVQNLPEWCEVLQRCLNLDPNLRPSALEVLNFPLFQSAPLSISSRRGQGSIASPLMAPDPEVVPPPNLKQHRSSVTNNTEHIAPFSRGNSGGAEVDSDGNPSSRRQSQISRDSDGTGLLSPKPNELDRSGQRRRSRGSYYGTVEPNPEPESFKDANECNGPDSTRNDSAAESLLSTIAEVL